MEYFLRVDMITVTIFCLWNKIFFIHLHFVYFPNFILTINNVG